MCFTLEWLEQLLVWCIIVGAIIAILRLVIPWALAQIGIPLIGQVINIVLWAIICIIVIWIVFALLSCLIGMGGVGLFPHHH
jgi:hypothetical protein